MSGGDDRVRLPDGLALRALELLGEAVCVVDGRDAQMAVVWVNPAFERLTGYAASEILGRNPRFLQGGDRDQPGVAEISAAMTEGRSASVVLRNYRPDGTMFWHALRLEPLEPKRETWWIGISREAPGEGRSPAEAGQSGEGAEGLSARPAGIDPVDRATGLRNARAFEAELARAWFACSRDQRQLALFTFAPDFFDVYGETFGRTATDSCLRMLGRAVAGCFRRATDAVGRTGEVEFAALATDMDPRQAEIHAGRVLERARELAVHNPRAPAGRYLTLSAGIAVTRPGRDARWDAMVAASRAALERGQAGGWERVTLARWPEEEG